MRSKVPNIVIGSLAIGLFMAGTFSDNSTLFGHFLPAVLPAGETGPGSEIEVPVSSGFGIYKPYAVPQYRPQVGLLEPVVAANFANVTVGEAGFPWNSYFTAGERSLLQKNNFVARPEQIGSFGQAYAPELSSVDLGSFITVDALLHGLRVTADEAMRDMERNYAAPALKDQLADLSESVATQATAERSQPMVEAGLQLLAYLQTGQRLLDPSAAIDPRVADDVSAELRNITSAAGRGASAVFPGRSINYAIFTPTGYYTIDQRLGSYYRAKTWLSSAGFNLRTQGGELDLTGVRAAAILARTMDGLAAQGDFAESYRNINEPLAFFSGSAAQGSSYGILTNSMRSYYGKMATYGTAFLNDDESLRGFIEYMEQQLPSESANRGAQPLFRILDWGGDAGTGELAQLWSDAGSSSGSYGLAVMGALGSRHAGEMQDSRQFRSMFSRQPAESWTQDLAHTVLYTVQPLAFEQARPEGYPRFMRSEAWNSRELTTALGAWADFQHGVGTMAMPAVAKAASIGGGGQSDLKTAGYVEPNPEAWARIASFASYLRNGLVEGRSDRMIGERVERKLRDIENVSATLMQIAAAELKGAELTDQQLEVISMMPSRIAAYETFADKSLQGDGYAVSAGAARVAGGTTVASGHPLAIYVIVPRNDGEEGLMLTKGAIASYYENGGSPEDLLRGITSAGGTVKPDSRLVGSYTAGDKSFAQDARKFQAVTATLPSALVTYMPTRQERTQLAMRAELDLESDVISRAAGELWFTVRAPQLEGNNLIVMVAGTNGQTLSRTEIGRVENGERLDMIRVSKLTNGQYFIRVADLAGKMIASGRFMVVR